MIIKLKIKKNEWDEFEVQYLVDGKKDEAKTYYTDDKEDAELTRDAILATIPKCLEDRSKCFGTDCSFWNIVEGFCEQSCLEVFLSEHDKTLFRGFLKNAPKVDNVDNR
jgi:hypothetical protein